jgi:DNA-directed RNA polymerase specialized sigma24 family protein
MLEWAARLRRRDTAALVERETTVAAAYRANLEPIYRFMYRKVGNRETAEDLTEEVFAKAVRGLHAGHAPQAVQAWLYATAPHCLTGKVTQGELLPHQ